MTINEKWDKYHTVNALFGKGRQDEIPGADLVIAIEMAFRAGQPRLADHYEALLARREKDLPINGEPDCTQARPVMANARGAHAAPCASIFGPLFFPIAAEKEMLMAQAVIFITGVICGVMTVYLVNGCWAMLCAFRVVRERNYLAGQVDDDCPIPSHRRDADELWDDDSGLPGPMRLRLAWEAVSEHCWVGHLQSDFHDAVAYIRRRREDGRYEATTAFSADKHEAGTLQECEDLAQCDVCCGLDRLVATQRRRVSA